MVLAKFVIFQGKKMKAIILAITLSLTTLLSTAAFSYQISPVGVYSLYFTLFNGAPLPPIPSTIVLQLDRVSIFSPPTSDVGNNSAYGQWRLVSNDAQNFVVDVFFEAVVSDAEGNVFTECAGGCSEFGIARMTISRLDSTAVVNWVGLAVDALDENLVAYPFANETGIYGEFELQGKRIDLDDVKQMYQNFGVPLPQ